MIYLTNELTDHILAVDQSFFTRFARELNRVDCSAPNDTQVLRAITAPTPEGYVCDLISGGLKVSYNVRTDKNDAVPSVICKRLIMPRVFLNLKLNNIHQRYIIDQYEHDIVNIMANF